MTASWHNILNLVQSLSFRSTFHNEKLFQNFSRFLIVLNFLVLNSILGGIIIFPFSSLCLTGVSFHKDLNPSVLNVNQILFYPSQADYLLLQNKRVLWWLLCRERHWTVFQRPRGQILKQWELLLKSYESSDLALSVENITLHHIVLHCITLYYIVLHCITLYYIVLHCIMYNAM